MKNRQEVKKPIHGTKADAARADGAAYLARQGSGCPWCGPNADIEGDSVDIDSGGASQKISCLDCGRQWWDSYDLVMVSDREGRALGAGARMAGKQQKKAKSPKSAPSKAEEALGFLLDRLAELGSLDELNAAGPLSDARAALGRNAA